MPVKFHWDPSGNLLQKYLRPQRGRVALLGLLLLGGIGLQLANPQVIRYFLDSARQGAAPRALLVAAALFIGFSLGQRLLSLAANILAIDLGWASTNALRSDLVRHCLRLDMSFHKQRTPGELIERVDGDVSALANYFSRFILQILGNGLLLVGILAMLFREDLRVGLGLTGYALVVFLILGRMHNLAVSRWSAFRQIHSEFYGFVEERISGAEEIRALGEENYILSRMYGLMRTLLQKTRAAFLQDNLMINLTHLLFAGAYAFGLALGVYLYGRGEASLGTAYLIVFYIGMISGPLVDLQEQLQDFQQAAASIQRIQELFRFQPVVKEVAGEMHPAGEPPPRKELWPDRNGRALGVNFRQVSFQYSDHSPNGANGANRASKQALEEISFELAPGKILGVLGRTGSGKTTLTRLLFRLYDPGSGAIYLGGRDLRSLPLAELRQQVGMVTQEVQLFGATLRDNLTLFNRDITDSELYRALRELRLEAWLSRLPEGLDTRLKSCGQGLSAGEAQLLAFTRVFLKDPGLVILDEASSRLDPVTEALLEGAVDRLLEGRTGLIIAHRLRTVLRADELLILEGGRVVECGARLALAADPGSRFSGLLQTGLEEVLQAG